MPALSSLRRLLIDKNIQEFQNPRDPTTINITKAFLMYDRNRSDKQLNNDYLPVASSNIIRVAIELHAWHWKLTGL